MTATRWRRQLPVWSLPDWRVVSHLKTYINAIKSRPFLRTSFPSSRVEVGGGGLELLIGGRARVVGGRG